VSNPKPPEKKAPDTKGSDKKTPELTGTDAVKADIQTLQQEIRILEGKLKNRRPEALAGIKQENEVLKKRLEALEGILLAAKMDLVRSKDKDEATQAWDALKAGATLSFQAAGMDEALWKDSVS
jgi:hypothetical protein